MTARVLIAFVLARAASTALWLVAIDHLRGVRLLAGPPFRLWSDALLRWDATYYESIARIGYPAQLPVDAAGNVLPNTWAFLPAFPFAAGGLAQLTHLPFEFAAVAWNLAAGAIACVLFAHLVRTFADEHVAFRAALFWMCLPTAFLMQVPYSETTFAMFAIASLLAMRQRREVAAALALVGAGLSRGFVLPVAAAALVHVASTFRQRKFPSPNIDSPPPKAKTPATWTLLAAAFIAPLLWPAIAALVTGRIDAVIATQGAWGLSPRLGDFLSAWRAGFDHDGIGLLWTFSSLTLAATIACAVAIAWIRAPRELTTYCVCAAGLIVLLAQPGAVAFGSVPRFAFTALAPPIVLAVVARRTWMTAAVVAALTWMQYLWIAEIWSGRLGVAP